MEEEKLNIKQYLVLALLNFTFLLSYTALSLLPPFLTSQGASNTYIGFFMNSYSLVLILFVIIFNPLVKSVPKKRLLLIGHAIFLVSTIIMYLTYSNLILLVILKTVSTISYAFGFTAQLSLVYAILPEKRRTSLVAIFGLSGIATNPVGSYLGELIVKYSSPANLFVFSAIAVSIAIVLLLFFVEDHTHPVTRSGTLNFWQVLTKKEVRSLLPATFIFGSIMGAFNSFIPNFTEERLGVANMSSFFLSFTLVAIVSRILLLKHFDHTPKKRLILAAFVCASISMGSIIFLGSKLHLFIIGLIYGAAHSILFPTLSSAFINIAPLKERDIYSNSFLALNTAGTIIISTLMGVVGDLFGYPAIFGCIAGLCLLVVVTTALSRNFPR